MKKLITFVSDGVEVGSMPEDEYQKIKKEAYKDKRLWLAQGLNVVGLIINVVVSGFKYAPGVFIAFLVFSSFFSHDLQNYIFGGISQLSTREMVLVVQTVSFFSWAAGVLVWVITTPANRNDHYIPSVDDCFKRAIDRKVKITIDYPINGPLQVVKDAGEK